MRALWIMSLVSMVAACGLDDGTFKTSKNGSLSMAITNAEGERDVLRTGTSLNLSTQRALGLDANTVYRVEVANSTTGSPVAIADLLTDMSGEMQISTVAHDVGEFDDVQDTDSLTISIKDKKKGQTITDLTLPLTPHQVHFEGHGFQVDEIQPPHVWSADATGKALNAYVVGGAPDAGETAAPIYVAGDGFPTDVTQVDVYIMKDSDDWQNKPIPQPGDPGYIHGPVVATVDRGTMKMTALDWQPSGESVGVYDIIVDVDRNGRFDYSFSAKDGADGEKKVGFTIQYGQAWYRARAALEGKHLLVNLAYNSSSRSGGSWENAYSRSSKIYSYVNPPVQAGARHAFVTKLVVKHQSWNTFWNNPERMMQTSDGRDRIYIADQVVNETGGTTQHSCTNSPPVTIINPEDLPADATEEELKFDVVFDYDNDGHYDVGRDLLDVVAHETDGSLISAKALSEMEDSKVFGFQVK